MVVQCELPGSQVTASGLMTPFSGASEWPCHSTHKKYCPAQVQLNAQMIAQNELLSLPDLCLTWGVHQIGVHTLRTKSRTTLHCLCRMCALKHRQVTVGQYVHSFPSRHRESSFPRTENRELCATPIAVRLTPRCPRPSSPSL